MTEFKKLGLNDALVKAISGQKITSPTKIQELSIPLILEGKDIIGESATGSGKTLAFGTGIIQNSQGKKGISAMVLTPTREIAQQVSDVLVDFSRHDKKNIVPIYGGVSINPQFTQLKTANIVVGTPGRILDHLSRGTLELKDLDMLVLDEADKMFDMGFIDDIRKIMQACPRDRQTLLYSATFSQQVRSIANRYMKEPERVRGTAVVDPTKLKQVYLNVPQNLKFSLLVHLLEDEENDLVLVFCNTKRMVDVLVKSLKDNKIKAMGIHGGLTQAKRMQSLKALKNAKVDILICTDVAARGLDIPDVTHVYNYDISADSKDYVHRVGRTARAGKHGKVINLLTRNDFDNFSKVLRDNPKLNIECEETPEVERKNMSKVERRDDYGRGGFRGGSRGGSQGGGYRGGSRGGSRVGSSGGYRGGSRGNSQGRSQGGRDSRPRQNSGPRS